MAAASTTLSSMTGESAAPSPALLSAARAFALESEIIDYTSAIYNEAVEDNRDWDRQLRDTMKLLDFLDGKHWTQQQRYARNRPVVPKLRRHFWDSVGMLTDLSIDFMVKMFSSRDGYSDLQRLLNDLAVHWAMSESGKLEDKIYDVVLYGLLHTGPAKVQWNNALMGGMGDVQIVPIAPWQWTAVGAGNDPQDSECILYFPVVTLAHIARRFGKEMARRVEPDPQFSGGSSLTGQFHRPGKISAAQWARIPDPIRQKIGMRAPAQGGAYPMTMLKEFWLRDPSLNEGSRTVTVGPQDERGNPTVNWAYRVEPGEPLYPRGRIITTAGTVVLEDAPNPYWHARFPFPVFRPFRVPWKLTGDPVGRSWMQMQTVINRIMGGVLDIINGIIEPTIIGPKGALPPADWDAIDPGQFGGKIKYNNNAPKPPEIMKRGEMPGWVFNYLQEVNKEYDMSSGAAAMQQALAKKQVPGGDSLEMILSSRSLPVKVESRALASFIEDGGRMAIANFLQFYSVSHRVAILGTEGITPNDFKPIYGSLLNDTGMTGEQFVRKFMGVVRRDTLLRAEKERKLQMAFAMTKAGMMSVRTLYEISDTNLDYDREKLRMLEEAKTKLLVAAAAAALTGKAKGHGK